MLSSTEKILIAATECFFQHGYAAANISMISRYAEVSRVTIHKQFKSKEALFRSVLQRYIVNNDELLAQYKKSSGELWSETEAFILKRCDGLFEEVSSVVVRTDLLHAGQSYCQDIIQANEIKVRESIIYRINKEITEQRMTLDKIDMSADELARLIEFAPFGLALSSQEEDSPAYVKQLIKVFKAATAV